MNPLTEEQRRLVEQVAPLAPKVVARVLRVAPSAACYRDPLVSQAGWGFVLAAMKYDSEAGRSWVGYAFNGAMAHCWRWLRTQRGSELESLDEFVNGEEGKPHASRLERLAWDGPSAEEELERVELLREVHAAVERLPSRQREAVSRHLRGERLRDVGARLGVSHQLVHQSEIAGLNVLRERFGVPQVPIVIQRRGASDEAMAAVHAALQDGQPRTAKEIARLVSRSHDYVYRALREVGAVQAGQVMGEEGRGRRPAILWTLPTSKEAAA